MRPAHAADEYGFPNYAANGNVSGLTWHTSYYSMPYFYYDGRGQTYTTNGTNVYNIWVRIKTYNDCDYWHQISSQEQSQTYANSVYAGPIPNGTSQCTSTTTMRVDGEHTIQNSPGGAYTFVATTETKNVPPW